MYKVLNILFLLVTFGCGEVVAGERLSRDDAVALTRKGIALIKAVGRDKAFAEFSNPSGPYAGRDFGVMDMNGKMLVYGENAKMAGKDLKDIRDVDGKAFLKDGIDMLQTVQSGWVDFKWPDPLTQKLARKSVYMERFGEIAVGSGVYN
ncbi:MAG: cache domain-containing protein [Pseudomonadota bacterium]